MKFFSLVLSAWISTAAAYPEGAGACPAGEAAPGGPHLTGAPGLIGPLSTGEFVMAVGGVEVSDGSMIDASLDFDITVTATGEGFKGILIRVGGATADQVTSSDLTAPASTCGDVGSVTHSNASAKTVGTASVSLDADSLLDVDISVVLENEPNQGISETYYSSFQINAVSSDLVTTSPPDATMPSVETSSPTAAIVDPIAETDTPTLAPVLEDMTDVTGTPTTPPVMEPTNTVPSAESDPPSMVSDETPSVESDSPSLTPVSVTEPTSDVWTYAGATVAFAGALFTLVV